MLPLEQSRNSAATSGAARSVRATGPRKTEPLDGARGRGTCGRAGAPGRLTSGSKFPSLLGATRAADRSRSLIPLAERQGERADCDDTSAARNPGNFEIYNAIDDDCDVDVDEDIPGGIEVCDSLDNDCDTNVDEGAMAVTWYRDADGDGRGTTATTLVECVPPVGYVQYAGDCDDANPDVFIGHPEACDGYDNNCNGLLDYAGEDTDADGHGDAALCGGVGAADDCDDSDPTTYPGATELCDRQDQVCGNVLPLTPGGVDPAEDLDMDGVAPIGFACSGGTLPRTDCDDTRASSRPGEPETCNGRDDDCDTVSDEDPAASASCATIPMGTPACVAGVCDVGTCASTYADCNGVTADGCEIDTATSEPHCGMCSDPCLASEACLAATCVSNYVAQISVDDDHACARRHTGAVLCWGTNEHGEIGDGSSGTTTRTPTPVPGVSGAVQVVAALSRSCAVLESGRAMCWGDNAAGRLGDGTTTDRPAPTFVSGITDAVEVAAGRVHTCARRRGGEISCWGDNARFQLGNDTITPSLVPTPVLGLPTPASATAIASDQDWSCAIVGGGAVYCWGYASLDDGGSSRTARMVPTLTAATQIVIHNYRACALQAGRVLCWTGPHGTPVMESSLTDATWIALGGDESPGTERHYCAIRTSGALVCWGSNGSGQCGIGTTSLVATPTGVVGLASGVLSVVAGHDSATCAVRATDALCWGKGGLYILGNGIDMSNRSSPTMVAFPAP